MINNQPEIHLKLLQIEQIKKQQKQLVIWLVTKLSINLQKKWPPDTSEMVESETEILKEGNKITKKSPKNNLETA